MNEKSLESLQSMVDIANTKETFKMKFQSDTSDFTIRFANPIQLNPKRSYQFALKRFSVYNSLANIDNTNNLITISSDNGKTWTELFIPSGAYEIEALNTRVQSVLIEKDAITIGADENTGRALLSIKKSGYQVNLPNQIH